MSLSSLQRNWKSAVDALAEFFEGRMEQKLCLSLFETFFVCLKWSGVRWHMSHDGS